MPHVILVSYTFVSSNPSTTEIYTLSYTTLFRAHLGLYPSVVANDGGSPNLQQTGTAVGTNTALATTGLDVRQVYLTFGNKEMGTFTLGRNIGLFGADVILNDMTLPGVGVAGSS